ncbi:putative lipoprotein YerB [Compostibacillus humi]|uniref:Putative lipoprotein YerB n=1 Tax=Compostibacillus humi TaxID=1245525 RepID=A0A8J2ZQW8_9BACI|nr:DUF3048 domain-containing protein [Compostibacillus humi]GGH73668.1 putative lipoprotein YerB [Compostibacillus humi]
MKKLTVLIVFLFMFLAACSNNETNKAEENKERESEIEEKPKVEEKYENVYPLTGIKTNDPVDQRIIGVMVNNHAKARPQTGLSQADIVFEILAEGPITRFLALFQSELPEEIGPVRSAREYYFELAEDYGALYIYHGAAQMINDMIYSRGIEHLDGYYHDNDGKLFRRDLSRKAPHNSYLLVSGVNDEATEKGYEMKTDYEPLPFLKEEEVEQLSGEMTDRVEIVYANNPKVTVEYEYNEDTEKYSRWNDGEQTVELNTEAPIQLDNIFIVEAEHQIIDDAGRRAVDLESGGAALLLQKGKVKQIEWKNENGRILPVENGEIIGFVPGKTWVNVVPTDPGLEQSVTLHNN